MMERKSGNHSSALRQQVVTSSPELRTLESKLGVCASVRHNKAAIAEKEVFMKLKHIGEREYADLVKQMDHEEKLSASLTLADQELRTCDTQRVLKEQIAEKAAEKAKAKAENVIKMMAEVDEKRLMEKEKKEHWIKMKASQENNRLALQKQTQLRKFLQDEEKLQNRHFLRSAEEYNLKAELKKEMERQKTEIQKLQQNQQELSLILKLEEQQREKDVIQDTKLELEILERSAQEKKFAEEREKHREGERCNLIRGLNDQVKLKREQETREQEKEDEYRKLLLEVMAEEGRLEQLVAEARRRRQLDHRALVECLLRERRAMREKIMKQHQLQDEEQKVYNQLRKNILEEEERQILLKHAPQLMPYFTPELHARFKKLL